MMKGSNLLKVVKNFKLMLEFSNSVFEASETVDQKKKQRSEISERIHTLESRMVTEQTRNSLKDREDDKTQSIRLRSPVGTRNYDYRDNDTISLRKSQVK